MSALEKRLTAMSQNGRRAKEEQRLDRWQSEEEQRRDNRC